MFLLTFLLQTPLRDGGQPYTETNLENLIAEPWNGASAVLFIFIVAYWYTQIRGRYREHPFITVCLPLLLIGGVGGTLYHTFRISQIFLVMDWLPILLLCLAVSLYFSIKVIGNWWIPTLIVTGIVASQYAMFALQPEPTQWAENVNYIVMALTVLIPTLLMMKKSRYHEAKWVGIALLCFVLAITFRILDPLAFLPMGTHFLWHVFGAGACFSMFKYVYEIQELELGSIRKPTPSMVS